MSSTRSSRFLSCRGSCEDVTSRFWPENLARFLWLSSLVQVATLLESYLSYFSSALRKQAFASFDKQMPERDCQGWHLTAGASCELLPHTACSHLTSKRNSFFLGCARVALGGPGRVINGLIRRVIIIIRTVRILTSLHVTSPWPQIR